MLLKYDFYYQNKYLLLEVLKISSIILILNQKPSLLSQLKSKYYLMKIITLSSLLLLLTVGQCFSQHIKRKGGLGVGFYQNVPDSIAKRLQYQNGAIIKSILPNTTASLIGLQIDDIVTKVNNMSIEEPNQILLAAKLLREDEQIEVAVLRSGKKLQLKGTVVGKPKETSLNAEVVYGEFAYKNGWVRTIYKKLKNKTPIGTIYFLQGLPCYSMDNMKELDKTRQALDAMVDRGFAVYRMEKADMGDNLNMPPCESMGYDDELDMYIAGYQNLLKLNDVDTSKIFLFGHSMGGITAPLVAEKFQPKGVVVYGTVFKPWMDYMMDAFRIQLQYFGEDLAVLRDTLEVFKPYIYDFFYNRKSIDEICKSPTGLRAMQQVLGYDPKTRLGSSGRSPLVFKEINSHNMAKAWRNTNSEVLAIYGECDIAANNADDHKELINYVNKIHPNKGTFWLAPNTTHTFEEIGTMEDYIQWQKDLPAYLKHASTKFNPKVFDYVCNWMKDVLGKK